MNLLYEMNKERGTTVLIPTDMAAAMGRILDGSERGRSQSSETTAS